MSQSISRREFLKLSGLGAAVTTALTGCGPATRFVKRQPYSEMPEYTLLGESTFYATTCGECPAGCGLIARTVSGRVHKVEGNPAHPVNHGNTCARGQATLQNLYNPDRLPGPAQRTQRGKDQTTPLAWDAAIKMVADAFTKYQPDEIAFILGLTPDHLFDLTTQVSTALGGANLLRYATLGEFESRVTLIDAAQQMFGAPRLPYFDIERAEVTFSFGANFTETWLSPVAYAYGYGQMRRGYPGQRGYLVQFEPRMSQTAANADEWFPIIPGSEGILAQAFSREILLMDTPTYSEATVDAPLQAASDASGVTVHEIRRLARIFKGAQRKVAIPGGIPMGHTNGLEAAKAILYLNIQVNNLGAEGGVYFLPDIPVYPEANGRPSSAAEMQGLVERLNDGQIKAVFIHEANPVYGLPASFGFAEALQKAELVVSFDSMPTETALLADYVLPGPTPLESFGYQKIATGADRMTISGFQPVVTPLHDTHSMADILLSAASAAGKALPFADEVAFLQQAVAPLFDQGGLYADPNPDVFWMKWLQHGGWWKAQPGRLAPAAHMAADASLAVPAPSFVEGGELHLLPFPHPNLGDGSEAHLPALQETPDPTTSVMWNTWVEINPETAKELGLHDNDVVVITSPAGKIEVSVYLYPAIRPDTIGIPLGQGHTAYGRYAAGRGANPLALLGGEMNASGALAFMGTKVKLASAGRTYKLARYESLTGIYGNQHNSTEG